MTCEHAGCPDLATVRTRFGDGTYTSGNSVHRQTFVRYCDTHYQEVAVLFHLCQIALEDGPDGLLRVEAEGRHPVLGYA